MDQFGEVVIGERLTDVEKGEVSELFDQYIGLARFIAKKISTQYGRSYHEVRQIAESRLAYELCVRKDHYDPDLSKRSTWLYQCIYWTLKTHCKNGKDTLLSYDSIAENDDFGTSPMNTIPDTKDDLLAMCRELTEDAQVVIDLIYKAPEEIVDDLKPSSKGRAREGVKWYLDKFCNWEESKIEKVWTEVEEWIREIKSGRRNFTGTSVQASDF